MSKKQIGIVQSYGSASGGAAYEQMVAQAVGTATEVVPLVLKRRRWLPGYFANMLLNGRQVSRAPDVLILTVNAAAFLNWKRHRHQKIIIIWHHHDPEAFAGGRWMLTKLYNILFERILAYASEVDVLVVVGEYWRSFFAKYDFRRIEVIYNAFDLGLIKSVMDKMDRNAVRKQLGVRENQHMVYIGQLQKMKSADRIWTVLGQREDLFLIGSGSKDVDLPFHHFQGSYEEYLQMLGACDLALSMSRMYEGWNRTAHEAMLMELPVIGNAIGNSGELLNGAGQFICHDLRELTHAIDSVLVDRDDYRNRAFSYVSAPKFSQEIFLKCWRELISGML